MVSCTSTEQPTYKWNKYDVTYNTSNLNGIEGVTKSHARDLFREAARVWSSHTKLKLREVSTDGDITVIGYDLSGNMLGLARYPHPTLCTIKIDTSNRVWTQSMLYKVMLHEIGHTLGLSHTPHRRSIMFYSVTRIDKLSSFDIGRLKVLYNEEEPN